MSEARPLIVRAPNHLGDLIMALPALAVARADTVLVTRWLAPLLGLADLTSEVLPFDPGRSGLLAAARRIRKRRYARGILLTPSFSSALLFRLGRVRRVRGSRTDGRAMLLDEVIPRERIDGGHRIVAYSLLVTGEPPAGIAVPTIRVPAEEMERWHRLVGAKDGPRVGVMPGGNASSRCWAPDRFAEVVLGLAQEGVAVIVFGGPTERDLTRRVACDGAFDAGGRTDLPLLAAGLASCDILLTNDSGPMHLAAAVGTPTLSIWGAGNPASTGPAGSGHRLIRRADLPCVPCVKNTCPRSGEGFILPNAERECLNLIRPAEVLTAARSMLAA